MSGACGPALLGLLVGFLVWTSVLQVTGRHLVAACVALPAAAAMVRLAAGRPFIRRPPFARGDQRGGQHGPATQG